MLLLLQPLSPTLCDPIDGSPPGRPSLGFSRQEHWSGLPFSSPMHESEKWKWSRSVVSDSSQPHGLQPTRLFRLWDFPGKSTGVGCQALLRLVVGALSVPLLMSMSEAFFVPFYTLIKLCYIKSSCVIKSGPWSGSYIFFGDHESDIIHRKLPGADQVIVS